MKKNFEQEVKDLENGLARLNHIIKDPNTKARHYKTALLNKEIQIARIDFFVRGYNFCKREINAQAELKPSGDHTPYEKERKSQTKLK